MCAYYIGAKVHLTTSDGVYEGTIHNVDPVQKRISLKKVIVLPGGKELTGIHNFFSSDIISLVVVDTKEQPEKVISTPTTPQTRQCASPDNDIDYQTVYTPQNAALCSDDNDAVHYTSTVSRKPKKPPKTIYQASDLFILTSLDDRYYEAMEDLQQQTEVGFSMEGINIGRNGTVSLVQFSTRDKLYIFDIRCLGRKGFNNGIGDIIESNKIMKVIHDCRALSDLLYHELGLNLRNVFDTQVADVIVWKREHYGHLPRSVKDLPACLLEYMDNIEQETVQFMKVQEKISKDDPELWKERPLDSRLLKYADRKVRNLLELRDMQTHYMTKDFRTGVEEYLRMWRDKTSTREKERVSAYASVPKSVNNPHQDLPVPPKQEETKCYFDRDIITQPSFWSREAWKEGRQFHEDDANEQHAWYREMKAQLSSATDNVAAEFEHNEQKETKYKYDHAWSNKAPYKRNTRTKMNKMDARENSKSDQEETRFRPSNKPNHILQTNSGLQISRQLGRSPTANDEKSDQFSSSLPSSSDELSTTTSTESSPYRTPSSKTSTPNRLLSDAVRNGTPEKKLNKQITKLTLKSISRDFSKLTSQSPPPLIASDGSSSLEEHSQERVPCFGQAPAFPDHMSYARAVSGEKATFCNRPESPIPSGTKTFTGRGRGTTIKSYRELLGNFQRPEESPIATLQGNAVRCDFPSDSVVQNAPRGINITKPCHIFGMAQ